MYHISVSYFKLKWWTVFQVIVMMTLSSRDGLNVHFWTKEGSQCCKVHSNDSNWMTILGCKVLAAACCRVSYFSSICQGLKNIWMQNLKLTKFLNCMWLEVEFFWKFSLLAVRNHMYKATFFWKNLLIRQSTTIF